MTEGKKYDVLAVGDAMIDTLVRADDSFLDLLKLEKNSVTRIDEEKAKSLFSYLDTLDVKQEDFLDEIKNMSGGSAANTAAGLSSLGVKVGYIGRVFADKDGKHFFQKLEDRGIDCLISPTVDGINTGRSLVIITPDGARTMCTFVGTKTQEEDVDEEAIQNAGLVFVPAFMMESAEGKAALNKVVRLASKHGVKIALSLSDPACVKRHQHDLLKLVAGIVDIVFANKSEASALVGTPDHQLSMDALKALSKKRPFIAAVTVGKKGVDIISQDQQINVPANKIEKIIDKTGVGALFASGFLYAYLQKESLENCGKLGNLLAAEGIKSLGARPTSDFAPLLENYKQP